MTVLIHPQPHFHVKISFFLKHECEAKDVPSIVIQIQAPFMQRVYFLPFCGKKAQGIENRSELQNLHFQHGEGPLQMSGPANGVPRSGKDLYHVDVSDSRVFVSQYGIHLSSRDSKTKGLPHSFIVVYLFNRLFLLLVSTKQIVVKICI